MAKSLSIINFPGIVAGILALVSTFTPWWGIITSVFGVSASTMYSLLGTPGQSGQSQVTSGFNQTMATYTPIVLALALITTALTLLGSFTSSTRPLGAGLFLAISTLVGFSVLVNYALSQNCQGNGCIREIMGSMSLPFNGTVNWGFQTGFYIFLGATIATVIALVYHKTTRTSRATTSTS